MSDPSSSSNPRFNMARGAATMTAAPPFEFENVILRVFPLRADIHALRLFCDRFLNVAPEYALFEPAAPYVILEAINYGRMSAAASNFGWVSQNEVAFAVLLNWYRIENGKPVFHDTASVCPFIFVDEETSVRGGREVFGWPKSLALLTPGIDAWARDPRSPRTLFTLSAMVFPELFAGLRQEKRVLLEIEQEPPPSATEFPVNPANELNPMVSLPRMLVSSMRMAGDLAANLARLPIQGYPLPGLRASGGRGAGDRAGVSAADFRSAPPWEVLRKALGGLGPFARLPAFNTVNLKQFRDSERPEEVCYQALVNAKMTLKSVKRGGLLGEQEVALGDPSGGFRLKLHRYKAWPIIESLGLEVASDSTERGRQVATLEPVLPNWMETDFHYGTGEVICWRSSYSEWAPPPGKAPPSGKKDVAREGVPARCAEPHPFNTAQGGSLDQVRGPFHFNDVTMRVLPLLADETKLQAFCDGYLNHRQAGFHEDEETGALSAVEEAGRSPGDGLPNNLFRAWGSYVYLIATSFEEVTSDLNVGWWARRQVSFAFPVKWYRYKGDPRGGPGHWHLLSAALVSPFLYADSSVAATTGREMQGRPVVRADIDSPSSAWLDGGGPSKPGELLKLSADVYPALNVGQKIERRLLLEITGRDALDARDEEGWRQVASGWGERLVEELRGKQGLGEYIPNLGVLKGLAIEILSGRRPINHVSLKQFRDAEDPHSACYQAITLSPETMKRVFDLREIDERLHVAIHRYPSQPIVETLGLEVKWEDSSGENVIDYLQPIRPFWLRANVEVPLGRDIFWRAGDSRWNPASPGLEKEPQCAADVDWDGSVGQEHDPLLFFERSEPTPFGQWEAGWVDSDPVNKRRLQDIGSERTAKELAALKPKSGTAASAQTGLPRERARRLERAELARANRASLETPLHVAWGSHNRGIAPSRRPISPQMALESILSSEWLHFGRPRWQQRKAAEVSDFDRRVRELAVLKGPQLLEKLRSRRITPDQLKAELEVNERAAPPLKKPFVIRQDSIGHAETRKTFELDFGLERLDDDYWYLLPRETKERKQNTRQRIREAVWQEIGEAWREELEFLKPRLHELVPFEAWPKEMDSLARYELRERIRAQHQSVDDLLRSLNDRLASARQSGEYERDHRYIQTRIQEARGSLETANYIIALLTTGPELDIEIEGEVTPLDAVAIANLGPKRKSALRDMDITSVERLSIEAAENLAKALGVSLEVAQQILADAAALLGGKTVEFSALGLPAYPSEDDETPA